MRCPSCGNPESKVVDSRPSEDGTAIRRRRECLECGRRFTTYERLGDNPLIVIKADGSSEAYDRQKLMRGLLNAAAKRPIGPEQIASLIDSIEAELRTPPVTRSVRRIWAIWCSCASPSSTTSLRALRERVQGLPHVEEFAAALEGLR